MELIKGRWYKNLGEKKDHIGKFDGWYNLNIISVSEYIYKGELHGYSECFTEAYKFAKECPLSEIQQFLPDGHPDKEFVLPEKWRVKDCEEVSKWASEVFRCGYLVNSSEYLCVDKKEFPNFNSYFFYDEDSACNYTEITFEQFKKYVLKTKEMEEREIIGYKLKEDCEKYIPALDEVCKCFSFGNHMFDIGSVYYEAFEEAGVLNLWFEPIFKEKFKVGDAIIVLNPNGTDACGLDINKLYYIIKIADDKQYGNEKYCSCSNIKNGSRVSQGDIKLSGIRLATSEEIKKELVEEAIKRGFKGGVKIDKTPLNYGGHTMVRTLGSSSSGFIYEPSRDELQWSASQDIVYRNGKWAKILPNYPQIEINGYKGEFFDWGVKFGCAEIDKDVFIRLGQIGQGLNRCNRALESVVIGKGTFSKDQIKLITEYYLNKK